jgi:hypothetical protein
MLAVLVEVRVTRPRGVSGWRSKKQDPFVALSKQDCDVSLGGKQGVVEGSRWIFPGPDGFCGSRRSIAKARS